MRLFCTILVQSKSFRCNTSEPSPMCCKQRTCAIPKFFRCNTYKKHRGEGVLFLTSHPTERACPEPAAAEERGISLANRESVSVLSDRSYLIEDSGTAEKTLSFVCANSGAEPWKHISSWTVLSVERG